MTTVDRIAALLAMAEGTTNEHEAEAFLAKAQTLATLASIDLKTARATARQGASPQPPVSRHIAVGDRGRRANKHLVVLFVVVARANDVMVDVGPGSTYVVAYGMPEDIDVTVAIWGSLALQMVGAANRFLATGAWRGETYVAVTRGLGGPQAVRRQHTNPTARAAFYQAYATRIGQRLAEARAEAVAETPAAAGAELVLASKLSGVQAFHRQTSVARGRWSGYQGAVRADASSATAAGRRAATAARIGPASALPGPGPALPERR